MSKNSCIGFVLRLDHEISSVQLCIEAQERGYWSGQNCADSS